MTADPKQYGSRPPGPLVRGGDPRVAQLDEHARTHDPIGQTLYRLAQDTYRSLHLQTQQLGLTGRLAIGVIVHSIPHLNWYKVQVGEGGGFIAACFIEHSSFIPLGVRSTSPVPPNSQVLVYKPRGTTYGLILGVIPPRLEDGSIVCPDWLVQGGQSGLKRELAYKYPLKNMRGFIDFSGQRPVDGTSLEWGRMAETGVGLLVDSFQAYLRVNEQCGLFLNFYDSYCRLAGVQLDISSMVHEESVRDDEGESRYFKGIAAYPWEAIGLYAAGESFTKEYSDKDVQYNKAFATVDLPEGEEDVQPFYRYQEYGGYLGQGHLRLIGAPTRTSGKRRLQDKEPDEGLFCESIALDGSYSLRSAKLIHIGKRCKIIVPREIRLAEDGKGDDAAADNYRFSGKFGSGTEHKIEDLKIKDDVKHMRRAAAVLDIIAFQVNWKALHPFHYHQGDYDTPQEGQQSKTFQRVQDNLDFGVLDKQAYMDDPQPKKLKIDHRYNEVEYFERESFLVFHDDGSVQLGCGYGSSLIFAGGNVRIDTPGDIQLCPGRRALMLGGEIVLRSKGSVDISSSNKDVRLKADRNMQLLAGNSGRGGLLLESKGRGELQTYENKIGEDVRGSGIVLKAAQSVCAVLGKNVYLRTGGPELGGGDILLDADQGKRRVQVYGREFNVYAQRAVNFYYGPINESSSVNKVYHFGLNNCIIDAKLIVRGKIFGVRGSGIILDGGVFGTKSFATAGVMADRKGMFLGQVPGGFAGLIAAATSAADQAVEQLKDAGQQLHQASVVQKFYGSEQIGNDKQLSRIQFSFRDDDSGKQYRVDGLKWPEARWQQLARLGGGSGGTTWEETPVSYQGRQLYPWPGREKWLTEQVFLQLESNKFFDAGKGHSKDRPYEESELSGWKSTTMASGFKLILS